jgi:hypothetical protein
MSERATGEQAASPGAVVVAERHRQHAERLLFLVPHTVEVAQHSSYSTENAWYCCLPLEVKTPITVEVQRKIMVRAAELAITYVNDFFDTTEERRLLLVEASPQTGTGWKEQFLFLVFWGN